MRIAEAVRAQVRMNISEKQIRRNLGITESEVLRILNPPAPISDPPIEDDEESAPVKHDKLRLPSGQLGRDRALDILHQYYIGHARMESQPAAVRNLPDILGLGRHILQSCRRELERASLVIRSNGPKGKVRYWVRNYGFTGWVKPWKGAD